jgi:hypothetical protein
VQLHHLEHFRVLGVSEVVLQLVAHLLDLRDAWQEDQDRVVRFLHAHYLLDDTAGDVVHLPAQCDSSTDDRQFAPWDMHFPLGELL